MDTWVWILIAIVAIAVVTVAAWISMRKRRTARLKEQFGPEYDRTVQGTDDRAAAESELISRQQRLEVVDIRPVTGEVRERYAEEWRAVQARFVDEPADALDDADQLVMKLLRERGYPMDSFEQRQADISVDHPVVVENYRKAHAISLETANGGTNTEQMRQGMVHYRTLFEDLLEMHRTGLEEER
jgi:hypothetical protein